MNRSHFSLRSLLLALTWLLLTPFQPHLHAHAMGAGSAGSIAGLHSAWAHDMPGPADSEFIAEVEEARQWLLAPVSAPPEMRLRSAEIAPSQPLPLPAGLPRAPPPERSTRHSQAP